MSDLDLRIADSGLAAGAAKLTEDLVADKVASRIAAKDATLWGPDAESEAGKRLDWVDLATTSRPLVAEVTALRERLNAAGVHRVVLAGMGGSSLAPEVICRTEVRPLTVLDTTDPGQVEDALAGDLAATVLVVSSKSGSTVETDSHYRIFTRAFREAGLDPAGHIVVVTDPGSPLQARAEEAGLTVINADPGVGGRYSALTAFGLVPAGLAGADIGGLLDDASAAAEVLGRDAAENPGLVLGAALAARHAAGAEKVVFADTGSGIVGFGDWAEQLIAESTGKQGVGLLPVVVESATAPGFADAGPDATPVALGTDTSGALLSSSGPLGGMFLLWEYATVVAGRLIGINPFDQPDVEAAKAAARALLDAPPDAGGDAPAFTEGAIEVYAGDWLPAGKPETVAGAIGALLAAAPDRGYLAVQAYLDRIADASVAVLRGELARASGLQTTFGWGPRFLHSTGQYHKGGHQNGVYLQLTGSVRSDLTVPDRPYALAGLQRAQALGDANVLAEHGRPVLRLNLTDREAGLVQLATAIAAV
ncbi:glucose-6-phosphate isomerase [Pseudonocardia eucalypti]|uniref:Glucose-6-phosphate isomerase n=1 Tax=Pseudonocardia eucalypti TaxID=648755 RepID=A0ABP9RB52_9PSEU|nr:glucose-6-phosphate isomerase [Pseudonocardia eucalypti]